MMYIGGKKQSRENMVSLDCSKFVVDGMVENVEIVDHDDKGKVGKFLKIEWNTQSGHQPTYIELTDIIGKIYSGDNRFISVDNDHVIRFMNDNFQKHFLSSMDGGLSGYEKVYNNYQFLAGPDGDYTNGAIGKISSDIKNLINGEIWQLKYINSLEYPEDISNYNSISSYLGGKFGDRIKNGLFIPVKFKDENCAVRLDDGLVISQGDTIIVHQDGDLRDIPVSDIKLGENVFVQKSGVSRREYLGLSSNLFGTIDNISSDITGTISSVSSDITGTISSVSSDLTGTIDNISSDITGTISSVSSDLTGTIDNISSDLTGTISSVSSDLTETIENTIDGLSVETIDLYAEDFPVSILTSISETCGIISVGYSQLEKSMVNGLVGTFDELCSGLSTKIYIENPDVNLSDYVDLSVVEISKDDYENLAVDNLADSKTIYIVSSNVINAYGQKIVNVQDATDLSDAVILEQLQ